MQFIAHRQAMLTGILVAVASAAPLQPSGKWVVDYAEHQCVASRAFSPAEKPAQFVIKPSPTSGVVQLIMLTKGHYSNAVQEDAWLRFDQAPPVKVKQLKYSVKGNLFRLINLPEVHVAALAAATSVEWGGDSRPTSFSMGPIKQLMKTLDNCRADLRNYWNITPEKSASLKERARPTRPILRYFSSDDYPAQALWDSEGGMTSVVMLVDEKGSIRDCMVDGTSGIATLDAMTCIILRERAKFEPAMEKNGQPARNYFMQRVRWEAPL